MSWITLAPREPRPGHLVCACDVAAPADSPAPAADAPALGFAAGVFALTVLTQALTAAVLPLAGVVLAPRPGWAPLPFALTLVGAGVATLPAALLTDLFGRRAALAMGASLGLAGGAIAAWSFVSGQFFGLALGAFWLGVAQGFGFFYRHVPVLRAADKPRAVGAVLGAGALAVLLAPAAVGAAQSLAGPLAPAAALLAVGAAEVVLLVVAIAMRPGRDIGAPAPARSGRTPQFLLATLAGAAAWFAMASLMANAAPTMALCGIGSATAAGVIAGHILSMYVPAALAGPWATRLGASKITAVGLAMILFALFEMGRADARTAFGAAMILAGAGWSLAMLGATIAIHQGGRPSTRDLALHDAALFAAAVAGALGGAFWR